MNVNRSLTKRDRQTKEEPGGANWGLDFIGCIPSVLSIRNTFVKWSVYGLPIFQNELDQSCSVGAVGWGAPNPRDIPLPSIPPETSSSYTPRTMPHAASTSPDRGWES